MAITEVTKYVDSNGVSHSDAETAQTAQTAINKAATLSLTKSILDDYIDVAGNKSKAKAWKSISSAKNSKNPRITKSGSNLGDIMRDLLANDVISLHNLSIIIGTHKYDLPKDFSQPTGESGGKIDGPILGKL